MYFMDFVKVLLRRWYVIVSGIVALGIAAAAIMVLVPTQYQATGQLLLVLPSTATGVKTPSNPYLNLQEGLTTTASLIAASVSTPQAHTQLKSDGFSDDYSIEVLPDAGPLIDITSKDTEPKRAIASRNAVMKQLGVQLRQLQKQVSVPERQVISPLPTNVARDAQALPGSKLRALVASAGAIMVLTLFVAFSVDRLRSPSQPQRLPARVPVRNARYDSAGSAGPPVAVSTPARRPLESGSPPDRARETPADVTSRSAHSGDGKSARVDTRSSARRGRPLGTTKPR